MKKSRSSTKTPDNRPQNITEKIRVSNLAELIYLDEGYFSNLFKATFGVSVKQYIMDKKIERAKTMLIADTPTSIVAETLNFYDTASFSNYFKKKLSIARELNREIEKYSTKKEE